jgi:GR25 family glycosyltransferase involved in LPS biosynthesis
MANRLSRYLILIGSLILGTVLFWGIFLTIPHDCLMIDKAIIPHQVERPNDAAQIFVISLRKERADAFGKRNARSGLGRAAWFPATNGYDQQVLNEWSAITKLPVLKASKFDRKDPKSKHGYANPHHVGCFMSHWQLLRLALVGWKAVQKRPDWLFVFEDDASCVHDTMQRTIDILFSLPQDWDLFYIGGKPFTYHEEDPLPSKFQNLTTFDGMTTATFRQLSCEGVFGQSSTGPFAPDGSRKLSLKQPYWETRYITNTQAYVVNPKHIDRILGVLGKDRHDQVPIDIALADNIRSGELKAYMPTQEFCVQGKLPGEKRKEANPWKGFYYHGQMNSNFWDAMYLPECPNKA